MRSESGYAYAKASWIVGKSFLGKRISSLNSIHTLNELDRLIFTDAHRELPGRELLIDLEKRITQRTVRQVLSVVKSYSQPPKLLVRMLKCFEYTDLKRRFTWLSLGKNEENQEGLNYDYYQDLIESLYQLDSEDRIVAARLLADEISLQNCILALRLRKFYHKSETEAAKNLMNFKMHGNLYQKKISLCSDARTSLHFSLDVRQDWKGWRWEKFLNHDDSPAQWTIDPRYFQNAAYQHLYHLSLHNFHNAPMTVSALYCFIKLKLFEEDFLISIAEGLSLGMDCSSIIKLLPIEKKGDI